MKKENKELNKAARTIRKYVLEMITKAGSGHPAGSLGMADVFAVLFTKLITKQDLFYLSNGHICPVFYASLAYTKQIPADELRTLRQLKSRLQGHPHTGLVPLVQNSGGSLGQGISQAVGAAIAKKLDDKSGFVYCVCGDGELEEGQVWEAALLAAHRKLDNLIQIIDRNHIQIDNTTERVLNLNPLNKKFSSFGYNVIEANGHDFDDIINAFYTAREQNSMPTVIIAHTIPGKGVGFMEQDYHWHGKVLSEEQLTKAINLLEGNL